MSETPTVRPEVEHVGAPMRTMHKIGGRLQSVPLAWRAAALGLRAVSQPRQSGQIRRYLAQNQTHKLRLGSGPHTDKGWLCADLIPLSIRTVFMDVTKPLPLPDESFDLIVCEHLIEQLSLGSARLLLAECRRIMRPGAVLRISTPDLGRLVGFMSAPGSADDDARHYVPRLNSGIADVPAFDLDNPVYMVNRLMRDFGHRFLYDEPTLTRLLLKEGFSDIRRFAPGKSGHTASIGVERHQEEIGERLNGIESMVLEVVAPTAGT